MQFSLPPSGRSEYFFQTLANWQHEFECFRVLTVQTPPIFAYYSDVFLQDVVGA